LGQEIARLRAERERLHQEREHEAPQPEQSGATNPTSDTAAMRLRLAELLMKLGTRGKPQAPESAPTTGNSSPEERSPAHPAISPKPKSESLPGHSAPVGPSPKTDAGRTERTDPVPADGDGMPVVRPSKPSPADGPVDPLALAQALFRTGDYEGALRTYRMLDPTQLPRQDQAMLQYMIATCLRRLGKLEEAAALYRDVANSKDDDILSECAQWQLGALEWRRDLVARLEQLRQRRLALESGQ
jgi:hypothetical protein